MRRGKLQIAHLASVVSATPLHQNMERDMRIPWIKERRTGYISSLYLGTATIWVVRMPTYNYPEVYIHDIVYA